MQLHVRDIELIIRFWTGGFRDGVTRKLAAEICPDGHQITYDAFFRL